MSTAPLVVVVAAPALLGLAALRARGARPALAILLGAAGLHLAVTARLWFDPERLPAGTLLGLDALGLLFLTTTSVVFFAAAVYSVPYLLHGTHDSSVPPRRFVPYLLWFLAAMSLVTVTQHLALLWAAVEATTLATAPLIYYYRRPQALEAAWKYLVICSVGIALALLAVFFLGIASSAAPGRPPALTVSGLSAVATAMSRPWLKAAFVLALVGFGTKMGLVPMHTWLPDAHSQAPSPVSALLSGALLNCAFLAIVRCYQVCVASGEAAFARTLLVLLGFASVAVATAFMVRQRDYKRLLAYSSVENMGIVALGLGLGGPATYGALLHAVNHSVCKAGLFLLSGNVLREFATTQAAGVRGAWRRLPVSGGLLMALVLAIGGSPPFGPFWSKFMIFRAALDGPNAWIGTAFAVLVGFAFLGMASTWLPMLQGEPATAGPRRGEAAMATLPPLALALLSLALGVSLPPALGAVLRRAAAAVGG
jgi:hydrogenase-4 component F